MRTHLSSIKELNHEASPPRRLCRGITGSHADTIAITLLLRRYRSSDKHHIRDLKKIQCGFCLKNKNIVVGEFLIPVIIGRYFHGQASTPHRLCQGRSWSGAEGDDNIRPTEPGQSQAMASTTHQQDVADHWPCECSNRWQLASGNQPMTVGDWMR